MSSGQNDGNTSSTLLQSKKRKIQRACDVCRRKKIRCDGVQMPGNHCSNCITSRFDCTYVEGTKRHIPLKGYLQHLNNRVNNLDKLLGRLCGDETLYNKLMASPEGDWNVENLLLDPSALLDDIAMRSQPNTANIMTVTASIRSVMKDNPEVTTRSSDADDPILTLADSLRRLEIKREGEFLGESSAEVFLRTVVKQKNEYVGNKNESGEPKEPAMKIQTQRPEFWTLRPWEQRSDAPVAMQYTFPDLDLALHCIDLYFKYSNLYLPLLHRPTFDKYVKEGLYLTDGDFAPVFLLVCAVGARHSHNPRVRSDGVDTYHSAGWKWFEQVEIMKRSLITPATLCDLQVYCLSIQYLQCSSAAESCWTLVGVGIRLAQDVGAHRRKEHNRKLTPDDELWKRAFWVLLCLDKMISSSLGRPCAIQDEHLDLDLPVDCDDEYWDNADPEKRFKQPPNMPSLITSFILYLKLQRILTSSLRTIYSINKSQMLLGFVGQQWEQQIVPELDSALNKWVASVPDHLRWDPNREDENFFNQSVSLYATYYNVQMNIHRTFIPSPNKSSPLPFPSLTICTNAARSCSHVLSVQRKRNNRPPPQIQMAVFTAGIVLLLNISSSKRSGLQMDTCKVADLHNCMAVLKSLEARSHDASILWDILYQFACTVELPLPQSPGKQAGGSDNLQSSSGADVSSYPVPQNEIPRTIAGLRRGHEELPFVDQTQQAPQPTENFPQQYRESQQEPPPEHTSHPSLHRAPSQLHDQIRQTAESASSIAPSIDAERTSHPTIPTLQCAPSRRQSHSEIRQTAESQHASSIAPSIDAELPVFSLPVYTNELGRLPLHGQVTFSAQAQPQTHSIHLDPQTNSWYPMSSSANTEGGEQGVPTPHVGAYSSYGLRYPPPPRPQEQQQHPHHYYSPQGIPGDRISSVSDMSYTQGAHGGAMAAGMMFDAFTQCSTDSSSLGMGWSSIPPPSSSSSSLENVFGKLRTDMMPDHSGGHSYPQHQRLPPQEEQQELAYPFVFGNDKAAISSNARAGFELNERGAYLPNKTASMQGHYPPA